MSKARKLCDKCDGQGFYHKSGFIGNYRCEKCNGNGLMRRKKMDNLELKNTYIELLDMIERKDTGNIFEVASTVSRLCGYRSLDDYMSELMNTNETLFNNLFDLIDGK